MSFSDVLKITCSVVRLIPEVYGEYVGSKLLEELARLPPLQWSSRDPHSIRRAVRIARGRADLLRKLNEIRPFCSSACRRWIDDRLQEIRLS